ncbi:hypothetical protein NEFER03_0937 [Nematocida sp. LUAm3]|nr:hypothetical protein NEFER03_0937 [Nematocida sp. LUAm3]KAI5174955.1 hypothetical protein NEFER02_1055 [Nematocida sp. LUAm2]KAI5177446.1 hypothetical protein NEFER01_0696 [Nematocida sp. LUAm1]
MLDSTLISRVGKYLSPEDKIKNSNRKFHAFMESVFFKKVFRGQCERNLQRIKRYSTYYKKYARLNLSQIAPQIENALPAREGLPNEPRSAILQERISNLEFQFKKITMFKRPEIEKKKEERVPKTEPN